MFLCYYDILCFFFFRSEKNASAWSKDKISSLLTSTRLKKDGLGKQSLIQMQFNLHQFKLHLIQFYLQVA